MALDPGDPEDRDTEPCIGGDGFEVETLITVRLAKAGLPVTEVPSFEAVRHYGASNLNAFSDGLRVLRTIRVESAAVASTHRLKQCRRGCSPGRIHPRRAMTGGTKGWGWPHRPGRS